MKHQPRIVCTQDGPHTTISGSGEMLWSNSDEFKEHLERASESAESLVVDLREACFIDTAVVQYILYAAAIMQQRSKRLKVLMMADSHPLHVAEITGLDLLAEVEVTPA